MAQAEYCSKCHRLKDIACTCDLSFAEKIRNQNLNWASWSATR